MFGFKTIEQFGDGPLESKVVILGADLAPITIFEISILVFGSDHVLM